MRKRVRQRLPVICVLALLLAALPRPELAQAVGFAVTTTDDAPHTLPINGNCTSTLPGNPCTLRAAVQAANFLAGTNTITLPAGIYRLTVTGVNEDAAATGDLDIRGGSQEFPYRLTLQGAGAASTIIDGNNSDRVLEVQDPGFPGPPSIRVTIADLTIRNGNATAGTGNSNLEGGGVRLYSGYLNVSNVMFQNNAASHGGAIFATAMHSTVINSAVFTNNSASTAGGGLYIGGPGAADIANSYLLNKPG